jgi:hypothetical protein
LSALSSGEKRFLNQILMSSVETLQIMREKVLTFFTVRRVAQKMI